MRRREEKDERGGKEEVRSRNKEEIPERCVIYIYLDF